MILIMETHHEEHVRRDPYMNLGAETILQSQRHTRGKQLQDKVSDPKAGSRCMGFVQLWDKTSIHRSFLEELKL